MAFSLTVSADITTNLDSGWTDNYTGPGGSGTWFDVIRRNLYNIRVYSGQIQSEVISIGTDVESILGWNESIAETLVDIFDDTGDILTYLSGFDIDFGDLSNLKQLPGIASDINYIKNSWASDIVIPLSHIENDLGLIEPDVDSIKTDIAEINTWLESDLDTVLSNQTAADGHLTTIKNGITSITTDVGLLTDIFASPEDLALKDATSESLTEVAENVNDLNLNNNIIGSFSFLGIFKNNWFDGLNPNSNTLQLSFIAIPAFLRDEWFSETTASNIQVGAGAANMMGVSLMSDYIEPDTPYLDAARDRLNSTMEDLGID